ncbi:MAG: NAD+ synthase [Bacteroidales bacterium]|nr:NAD+ synthase [Bacteroidales bacterium]MBN2698997.1 NAD+ synthase [Bacteroidales bacterium]
MNISVAQLNYTIGDFEGNLQKIRESICKARKEGADLVVFSELAICGYPPLDLLERHGFTEQCNRAMDKLASETDPDIGILIGGPEINPRGEGKMLYNSAFFLSGGKIVRVFRKTLLPTYDIFDEYRYFEPNRDFTLLHFRGKKIAVTICEDLWDEQPFENEFYRSRLYTISPMDELAKEGPDLVINLSASPFSHSRQAVKQNIFIEKARKHNIPVIICNQAGAQTELIFEGGSSVINAGGTVVKRLQFFREDFVTFSLDGLSGKDPGEVSGALPDRVHLIRDALVCGISDYFKKLGFDSATLGLSGGIDSAVVTVLAAEALGPEKVHVLLLPSQYSSEHSITDSITLAKNLGIKYDIIPIKELFLDYVRLLKPLFGDSKEDVTEENIQSRIRATLLMALSNKFGNILLNTSNKSEAAVGYGTLYGDMAGGLSVLGDVYKTDVYRLARFINHKKKIIPLNILTKEPSAELKPGQKDSDSLPPYDLLDPVLELFIEKQMDLYRITALGFDRDLVSRVIRMVNRNEYKRYQTPPILRISSKAFGVGRRIPIVAKY